MNGPIKTLLNSNDIEKRYGELLVRTKETPTDGALTTKRGQRGKGLGQILGKVAGGIQKVMKSNALKTAVRIGNRILNSDDDDEDDYHYDDRRQRRRRRRPIRTGRRRRAEGLKRADMSLLKSAIKATPARRVAKSINRGRKKKTIPLKRKQSGKGKGDWQRRPRRPVRI